MYVGRELNTGEVTGVDLVITVDIGFQGYIMSNRLLRASTSYSSAEMCACSVTEWVRLN